MQFAKSVYIDESGTLPDQNDRMIVLAGVSVRNPKRLDRLISRVRVSARRKQKLSQELKFYTSGEKTKRRVFTLLLDEDIDIFVLVVHKEGKSIPDTPTHFAMLCTYLISEVMKVNANQSVRFIFDRHFHRAYDRELFNRALAGLVSMPIDITHTDSMTESAIQIADMIAGAVLWAERGKDTQYYNMFKDKIVREKEIRWKSVKAAFITKKIA